MLFLSIAILEGTDDNKGKWFYSPEWFPADDKGTKTNSTSPSTDAPAKGLNTALSGDTSPTAGSLPSPATNPPLPPTQAPDHTSIPAVPPASSPTQVSDSSVLPTTPIASVPLVEPPPLEGPNLPPVQAPSIPPTPPPPAAEALVASLPPTNSPLDNSSPPPSSPPPSMPPTQDSYCPAATHFNRFSSGPNYIPQSGYNPVGPAGLSAQVGNRSHEMAGNFHNVGQSQSNTNTIVVLQNTGMGGPTVSDFNLTNYLRNPTKYISGEDYQDAYQGAGRKIFEVKEENSFFDTITCGILTRLGFKSTIAINIIRLVYFLFQFFYPIIVAIVQGGPVAFNVVCSLFAFVGLVYDIYNIGVEVREKCKSKPTERGSVENNEVQPEALVNSQNLPGNINGLPEPIDQLIKGNTDPASAVAAVQGIAADQNSAKKETTTPRKLLREFAKDMLEEIIIYPSLICNLYSFINERGWEFNNAVAVFDFLLTLVSFSMDAILAKINHVWLLYHLIGSTGEVQRRNKIHSYITPFNLFFPFSIGLVITHILMVILIAIRIYADNFNTIGRDKEPDEGDYSVAPFTRYMIFCGAYLPLMSSACYIILNKHWFLQVSWILYNEEDATQKMNYLNITSMPVRVKLFGFLRDRYAYIAVSTFVPLFIAFYHGGFLRDYDPDYLPSGALSAANTFCTLFVLVFSIINFQAGIIFTIIMVLLMIMFCFLCTGGRSQNVQNLDIRRRRRR